MYWGNSLLGVWDEFKGGLADGFYWLGNLINHLLYYIWRLIAGLINGLEGIFRNLAGIGSSGKDMASEIINNTHVQLIFSNMVGLSMALIVFFTIVKIIQEHYKEKDGGNPYKIILRTFKGLLMFFFVSAAVTVGLQASGVMFRALDAATGSGSSSVAGQIFKAMAYDANRKRLQLREDTFMNTAFNNYYKAGSNASYEGGRYFVTEVTGNQLTTAPEALSERYLEEFPSWQYVIVENGQEIPSTRWINTSADLSDSISDNFDNYNWGKGYVDDGDWSHQSVGFRSDLMRGIDLTVQPTIDLSWSPINIMNYSYRLFEADKIDHSFNISIPLVGSQVISSQTQLVKFIKTGETFKSLEGSSKAFGITLNGKVKLQAGEAAASYKIGNGELFSDKFDKILFTILTNVVYTNTFQKIIEVIPSFPAETSVGPLIVNWVSTIAPLIGHLCDGIVEFFTDAMKDGDDIAKDLVDMWSTGASEYNAGIWVTMDTDSKFLETTIERYEIDGNFADLWGQLSDNLNRMQSQLTSSAKMSYQTAEEYNKAIKEKGDKITSNQQQNWRTYKTRVDQYNDNAITYLNSLGNMLSLWNNAKNQVDKNFYLERHSSYSDFDSLESDIRSVLVSLVRDYNTIVKDKKPQNSFADASIVPSIYKPIIEFNNMSEEYAQKLSIQEIYDLMLNEGNKPNRRYSVNMSIDSQGFLASDFSRNAYRCIDWSAYGREYEKNDELKNVSEIYYDDSLVSNEQNPVLYSQSKNSAVFAGFGDNTESGVLYFVINGNNDFRSHANLMDYRVEPGYWGVNGIQLENENNPIYYRYDGLILSEKDDLVNSLSTESLNVLRTSSANSNQLLSIMETEQSKVLDSIFNSKNGNLDPKSSEFSKNIVEIYKVGIDGDVSAESEGRFMKSWITASNRVAVNGNHTEKMLYSMSPEAVDNEMALSGDDIRRYLLKTKNGKDADDTENWSEYIGQFSWTDVGTVKSLYEFAEMDYFVGMVAVIAAAGVYMNFAFGLIQRAVNMAVLYAMSPITIAFYPFDDGAKFNGNFVKPFYNEAVSAFAVIVSLNLFIVLLTPVQKAVKTVLGGGMVGWIASWLGLVAFVSMLPQIRDSISSILGGGKLAQKSLSDTITGFRNTMGQPYSELKKRWEAIKKPPEFTQDLAHGIDKFRQRKNKSDARKDINRQQEIDDLEEKKKLNGELTKFEQHRLDKLKAKQEAIKNKKDKKLESQNRIDAARSAGVDSEEYKNLSFWEKRRLKRQDDEAERLAKQLPKKDGESDEDYSNRVNEKKASLLSDPKFKKSIKGVVSLAASRVKNSTVGKTIGAVNSAIGYTVGNSIFADMLRDKYGKNGSLAGDKNSARGAILRLFNPDIKKQDYLDAAINLRDKKTKKYTQDEKMFAAFVSHAHNTSEGNAIVHDIARRNVAAKAISGNSISTSYKYNDLLKALYIQDGKSESDAIEAADEMVKSFNGDEEALLANYNKLGGDARYAMAIANGWQGLSIKLKEQDVNAEKNKLIHDNKLTDVKDSSVDSTIADKLNIARGNKKQQIDSIVDSLAGIYQITDNEKSKNKLRDILLTINQSSTYDTIQKDIQEQLGIDKDLSQEGLNAQFANIAQIQFNSDADMYEAISGARARYVKANKDGLGKIGNVPGINETAVLLDNLLDESLESFNPNSTGAKLRANMEKHRKNGTLNSADFKNDEEKIRYDAMKAATEIYDEFSKKNRAAFMMSDVQKKAKEEYSTVRTNVMYEEILNQRGFITDSFDVETHEKLINDPLVQELKTKGDYAGLGLKQQMLIDAVNKHENEVIDSLGFGSELVDFVKDCERNGGKLGQKRLENIRELGAFDSETMGSITSSMGGDSIMGIGTAFAQLVALEETKQLIAKMQVSVDNHANNETNSRNIVRMVLDRIRTNFGGEEWKEFYSDIKSADGSTTTNSDEFCAALKKTLSNADSEIETPFDAQNLKALADIRKTLYDRGSQADIELARKIDNFNEGINNAHSSVVQNAERQIEEDRKSKYENLIAENVKKIGHYLKKQG